MLAVTVGGRGTRRRVLLAVGFILVCIGGWLGFVSYLAGNHKAMISMISAFQKAHDGRTPRSDEELLQFVDRFDDAFLFGGKDRLRGLCKRSHISLRYDGSRVQGITVRMPFLCDSIDRDERAGS